MKTITQLNRTIRIAQAEIAHYAREIAASSEPADREAMTAIRDNARRILAQAEAEKTIADDDCRTCDGERMIDASDSTPNEYFIPCPTCCPGEQRITGPTR